jgi:acyl carrier protein
MSDLNVEQRIREFILKNYLFTDDQSKLANEDSFLEHNVLDSTGVLEVIMFLGEAFEIRVEDDEMIPENLDSVRRLVDFVHRKHSVN